MKKVNKEEVKTWLENNKKKLIIGGSVIVGGAVVYFGGKELLQNRVVMNKVVSKIQGTYMEKHNVTCLINCKWFVHPAIDSAAIDAIIDTAGEQIDNLYRTAGLIE